MKGFKNTTRTQYLADGGLAKGACKSAAPVKKALGGLMQSPLPIDKTPPAHPAKTGPVPVMPTLGKGTAPVPKPAPQPIMPHLGKTPPRRGALTDPRGLAVGIRSGLGRVRGPR